MINPASQPWSNALGSAAQSSDGCHQVYLDVEVARVFETEAAQLEHGTVAEPSADLADTTVAPNVKILTAAGDRAQPASARLNAPNSAHRLATIRGGPVKGPPHTRSPSNSLHAAAHRLTPMGVLRVALHPPAMIELIV